MKKSTPKSKLATQVALIVAAMFLKIQLSLFCIDFKTHKYIIKQPYEDDLVGSVLKECSLLIQAKKYN